MEIAWILQPGSFETPVRKEIRLILVDWVDFIGFSYDGKTRGKTGTCGKTHSLIPVILEIDLQYNTNSLIKQETLGWS